MAGGGERGAQRAHDQAAHDAGVAEADLGLGGMDVDVDHLGRRLEEQRHHRMAVARQEILVGAAHGAGQQLVAHRPAVDEEILVLAGRPVERRQAGEAAQAKALAVGVDGQRIVGELAAHDGAQPRQPRGIALSSSDGVAAGEVDQRALLAFEAEGDRGMGHREAPHRIGDMARFGARLLQELQPGGRGKEEIAHLDPRARRMRGGPRLALGAAVDLEAPRGVGAGRPRGDGEAAHRGDRRQRLAAEAQGADVGQIIVRQLGGAVPLDRELQLLGAHADAVVDHGNEGAAAFLQGDGDAVRAGVDGVLDQLLHGARRTLDDLARGDAVHQGGGKAAARRAHGAAAYDCRRWERYWRVRTLPSSTAGWSKASIFQRWAANIVSRMKCIISAPIVRSSTVGDADDARRPAVLDGGRRRGVGLGQQQIAHGLAGQIVERLVAARPAATGALARRVLDQEGEELVGRTAEIELDLAVLVDGAQRHGRRRAVAVLAEALGPDLAVPEGKGVEPVDIGHQHRDVDALLAGQPDGERGADRRRNTGDVVGRQHRIEHAGRPLAHRGAIEARDHRRQHADQRQRRVAPADLRDRARGWCSPCRWQAGAADCRSPR